MRMWKWIGIAVPAFALTVGALAFAGGGTGGAGGGGTAAQPPTEKPAKDEAKDLVGTLTADKNCSTLVELVIAAGLTDTLKSGEHTVFAPSNDAFKKLGAEKLADLKKPANKDALKALLNHHIVKGKVMAADIKDGSTVTPIAGGPCKATVKGGKVMVDNATVTKADVTATNGVIHMVDTVLADHSASPKPTTPPAPAPEKPKSGGGSGGG